MEEKIDLRIIKTKSSLIDALFDTLKKKVVLKVLYVCKKANITSSTFYKHFRNKNHLLRFAIKNQLENKLPIPLKLKPKNLKQLMIYLINFFHSYIIENNEIVFSCYHSKSHWKKTYFKVLTENIEMFVNDEIKQIFRYIPENLSSVWSENIVGGLFYLFIKRIIDGKSIDKNLILNCLIQLYNKIKN